MKENMVKEACNALSISNKESLGNYVSVDLSLIHILILTRRWENFLAGRESGSLWQPY